MLKLGFSEAWVDLVMQCVETVSYNFFLNGQEAGSVTPSRGLRQGDPISPYLFIICSEGLTSLLQDAEERGMTHGVTICRNAPPVSNLLFADDSFFFTRASRKEALALKDILMTYQKASGQQINLAKSGVSFSANIPVQDREAITLILGIQEVEEHGFYLGFPAKLNRSKTESLKFVKEKVQNRVLGWSEAMLSQAGREVLIKSVAQSVPTYAMGVVRIPDELCTGMENCFNKFFWDANKESNGIHWRSWDRLTRAKNEGGLGFRSLYEFNSALLAKQAWRIITSPNSLVSRLFKAKYFPRKSLFEVSANDKASPSYSWRSIMSSMFLLKEGMVRRIGSGKGIEIWKDPWLPSAPYKITSARPEDCNVWFVSDLIEPTHKLWNHELLLNLFSPEEVNQILQIPLALLERPDGWKWSHTNHGNYTTKSGYYVAREIRYGRMEAQVLSSDQWKCYWKLQLPEKIKVFGWRAITNCLPVKSRLRMKGVDVDEDCPMCEETMESVKHLLCDCETSRVVWSCAMLDGSVRGHEEQSFSELVSMLLNKESQAWMELWLTICWFIWIGRNNLIWRKRRFDAAQTAANSFRYMEELQRMRSNSNVDNGPREQVIWRSPPENDLKVNVDGAIFTHTGRSGVGAIIRDWKGELKHVLAMELQFIGLPLTVEALAMRKTLHWMVHHQVYGCWVESDCLQLVNDLQKRSTNKVDETGMIIQDCIELGIEARVKGFIHTKRDGNRVAHHLAQLAQDSHLDTGNWDFIPPFIQNMVLGDIKTC